MMLLLLMRLFRDAVERLRRDHIECPLFWLLRHGLLSFGYLHGLAGDASGSERIDRVLRGIGKVVQDDAAGHLGDGRLEACLAPLGIVRHLRLFARCRLRLFHILSFRDDAGEILRRDVRIFGCHIVHIELEVLGQHRSIRLLRLRGLFCRSSCLFGRLRSGLFGFSRSGIFLCRLLCNRSCRHWLFFAHLRFRHRNGHGSGVARCVFRLCSFFLDRSRRSLCFRLCLLDRCGLFCREHRLRLRLCFGSLFCFRLRCLCRLRLRFGNSCRLRFWLWLVCLLRLLFRDCFWLRLRCGFRFRFGFGDWLCGGSLLRLFGLFRFRFLDRLWLLFDDLYRLGVHDGRIEGSGRLGQIIHLIGCRGIFLCIFLLLSRGLFLMSLCFGFALFGSSLLRIAFGLFVHDRSGIGCIGLRRCIFRSSFPIIFRNRSLRLCRHLFCLSRFRLECRCRWLGLRFQCRRLILFRLGRHFFRSGCLRLFGLLLGIGLGRLSRLLFRSVVRKRLFFCLLFYLFEDSIDRR